MSRTSSLPPMAQKMIFVLSNDGLGYKAIAAKMAEQGHKMSHMTVKRYLESIKGKTQYIMTRDQNLAEIAKDVVFDTIGQLRKLNGQLWNLTQGTNLAKDFNLKILKEIRETIRLADQVTNKITGSLTVKQTINRVQMVQYVNMHLHELEQRGEIQILNPKLKDATIDNVDNADKVDNADNADKVDNADIEPDKEAIENGKSGSGTEGDIEGQDLLH